MTEEVIYVTNYFTDRKKLQEKIYKEYDKSCQICNAKKDIVVTSILPEVIYTDRVLEN